MGRPTKLDDLTAQAIVNAVAKGLPRDTAARLARVSPRALYNWLRLGREGDPGYVQFLQRVTEAESKGEEEIVGLLRSHAKASWQACAWLLERRRPSRWAPRKQEAAAAPPSAITSTSPEERVSLLESMLAAERSAG